MNSLEIKNAFSQRKLIDIKSSDFNFEDLACSVSALRMIDQINIIPSLMIYILENKFHKSGLNYAEMVVFRLMPQPLGWENLMDYMNRDEIFVTIKWLNYIEDYSFVENCRDELCQTIQFFQDCYSK